MTEQQREQDLLSELLDLSESEDFTRSAQDITYQPLLTRRDEQELLRAANQVGTPSLAPEEIDAAPEHTPGSFVQDLAGVARKYPVLAALAAGGVVFLLARRRRR